MDSLGVVGSKITLDVDAPENTNRENLYSPICNSPCSRVYLAPQWDSAYEHLLFTLVAPKDENKDVKVSDVLVCVVAAPPQDYHWWWRSFIVSGGSAIYVGAYAFFYFFTKLEIDEFVPTLLYFG